MPTITPPKKLPQSRTQSTVVFSPEEKAKAEEQAARRIGQGINLPGFRPGMAPLEMLKEKIPAHSLLDETLRALLPDLFSSLVKENNLRPIAPPKVEVKSTDPLTVDIIFVEPPEVTLKGADKIKIEKKEPKFDQKDIDRMVQYLLDQHRTTVEVDREAKDGDEVVLDFFGNDVDGKEIGGTRATAYPIVLGSKSLIPGFEDAVIGMKKGEQKSFTLTFPADYHAEHLRNKPVTFTITVVKVQEVKLPDLTDEFVKEKQLGASAAELKANIEQSMRAEEEGIDRRRRENELFDAIRKATVIDLAPELIEQEERAIVEDIAGQLERQKTPFEAWLTQTQRTPESFEKEVKEEATKRITLRFGIEKLLEEKKIEVTDQELTEAVQDRLEEVPQEQRIQAAGQFQKGTQAYDQVVWQKKIEKLVEGMLAA